MTTPEALPRLAPRPRDSHKGDFGRALLIGGSPGMAGAIGLSGMAALRGGAGLVTVAVSESILNTVAGFEPSYMTAPLPADQDGRLDLSAKDRIREFSKQATCIGCGPGIGRSAQVIQLVSWMYTELTQPMVVDADALFALAEQPDSLQRAAGPRILTPHPGEFGRLAAKSFSSREAMEDHAIQWAQANAVVLVLKGHRTLISDGTQSVHNNTGNPGMATGGCGDVLTGLITALVCQGLSPWDAARLGVHVHGLAGDLAAVELGEVSMIASDLLRFLPRVLKSMSY